MRGEKPTRGFFNKLPKGDSAIRQKESLPPR